MRRRAAGITSVFILSLSIVSTTFVLLALTSKQWSIQKYYLNQEGEAGNGVDWITPICVANKSPFYRCDIPYLDDTTNPPTCVVPNCQFYEPYGWNATSCRLASETRNAANSASNGGEQECQEVHYTGNLQIAASVFITLGLISLVQLTLINFLGADPSVNALDEGHASRSHYHKRISPLIPYIVLMTLFSLYVGAILQVLAQFFGVLGLTVNATPTAYQAEQNNQNFLGATPWIMDKALTTYATVAWTMAVACAGLVGFVYRTPKFPKLA